MDELLAFWRVAIAVGKTKEGSLLPAKLRGRQQDEPKQRTAMPNASLGVCAWRRMDAIEVDLVLPPRRLFALRRRLRGCWATAGWRVTHPIFVYPVPLSMTRGGRRDMVDGER